MHKYGIAREAKDLAAQLRFMRTAEDWKIPLLVEDIRARIDFAGFTLEDVVQAGMHALGRVPAGIIQEVAAEQEWFGYVSTTCWRQQIERMLEYCPEHMEWRDRTFVKKLLTRDMLGASEIARLEQICVNTFTAAFEAGVFGDEDEDEAVVLAMGPAPSDQLNLDV